MVGRRKVIASRNRRLISPLTAPAIGFLAGLEHSDTSPVASMARKRDVRIKAVRKSVIDPAIATHRGRMVKTTGAVCSSSSQALSMQCDAQSGRLHELLATRF